MKTARTDREPGSVLVFVVLILAVGAFVLAGIAQLGATQALVGHDEWASLNRRVRVENSRALARQYVLQRMFSSAITNVSYTNASGLGGFTLASSLVTNFWTTLSDMNTNASLKINPFTLMERGGFYRTVIGGTVSDGVDDIDWNFQVRTRSPITAGYPVVQHKPANYDVSPLADTNPYVDMNDAEQFIGFHDMARMRVSSVSDTSMDANGYIGYLDPPIGIAAYGFFTQAEARPSGVAGQLKMVVNLGSSDPNDVSLVLVYEVPAAATYTNTNAVPPTTNTLPVSAVELIGTDSGGLKPLQVIIPAANSNTGSLILTGSNHADWGRPVYVNYRRPTNNGTLLVTTTNVTGSWRIGITAARSDIEFDGGITIFGGVRTDGRISGNPVFRQDLNPQGLDYIADRMMWLEDYKTP